jgi:NAD(P)H-hydrate epimerase
MQNDGKTSTTPLGCLTSQQVREIDRLAADELGLSGRLLMENAGHGVAEFVATQSRGGPILIACGPGNNGGDGFVAARHLDCSGLPVTILLAGNPARRRDDAWTNFALLEKTDVQIVSDVEAWLQAPPAAHDRYEWLIDAMLGIGAKGEPRAPLDSIIPRLNQLPGRRLAVDIPSGLDADSGRAAVATFRAADTCTFVAAKPGLVDGGAAPYVGRLHVLQIGIPRGLIRRVATCPPASQSGDEALP